MQPNASGIGKLQRKAGERPIPPTSFENKKKHQNKLRINVWAHK